LNFSSRGSIHREQKRGSSEKYSNHRYFVAIVVFVLGELPRLILPDSAWIRNNMKTKIQPLSQHGKSLWIRYFSEQSKGLPKWFNVQSDGHFL
jgi:hypothetical protein